METTFGHLQINVRPENLGFYRELMGFLGWATLADGEGYMGFGEKNGASLWFIAGANDAENDYDGRGVNHIGIGAASQADVDATVAYLQQKGVPPLFETPRHRPDFSASEDQTYYQVMFESPDRVLFEVVYTGPKS
ncbi:MAG TPA: VOC family protein [Tepidiformaceae bacterium]|nr:VOC family protein [Tepidiformaceae bacterium]